MPRFIFKKTASGRSSTVSPTLLDVGSSPKSTGLKLGFIKRFTKRGRSSTTSTSLTPVSSPLAQSSSIAFDAVMPIATMDAETTGIMGETGTTLSQSMIPTQLSVEEKANGQKMVKVKKVLATTLSVVVLGLEGLAAASDAFPPAKSVAGGLQHIIDVIRKVQDDEDDGKRLLQRIEALGRMLESILSNEASFPKELEEAIAELDSVLVKASDDISHGLQHNVFGRLTRLRKRSGQRRRVRESIENAIKDFEFRALVHCASRLVRTERPIQNSLTTLPVSVDKYPLTESNAKSAPLFMNSTSHRLFFLHLECRAIFDLRR